eukprot:scaffold2554_cov156-Amphora_coffeaeformis.AAC.3
MTHCGRGSRQQRTPRNNAKTHHTDDGRHELKQAKTQATTSILAKRRRQTKKEERMEETEGLVHDWLYYIFLFALYWILKDLFALCWILKDLFSRKPQDPQPQIEDEIPHAENGIPHAEDEHPHAEDEHPHAEDEHPHTEDEIPHAEDEIPHAEDENPHAEDENPHAEDESPHVEDKIPPTEDEIRRAFVLNLRAIAEKENARRLLAEQNAHAERMLIERVRNALFGNDDE